MPAIAPAKRVSCDTNTQSGRDGGAGGDCLRCLLCRLCPATKANIYDRQASGRGWAGQVAQTACGETQVCGPRVHSFRVSKAYAKVKIGTAGRPKETSSKAHATTRIITTTDSKNSLSFTAFMKCAPTVRMCVPCVCECVVNTQ